MALKRTVTIKCELHTPTEIIQNEDGTLTAVFKVGDGPGLRMTYDSAGGPPSKMMIPYETATNGEGPFLLLPIEEVKET